mgnify:CR=1 FL=1
MYEKYNLSSVLIEITNVCNLKCSHCFNSFDRAHCEKPCYMPVENVRDIIEKCDRLGLDKLYFSGGEPLCHPQFMEILRLCHDYKHIHFTVTTNGTLITPVLISVFESYSNLCIQISVDSLNRDVYEKQRGGNTFDLFKNAYDMLLQSKIKYLTARTCVSKLNYKETTEIYEQLVANKVVPSFLFVNKMGNAEKIGMNFRSVCQISFGY